MDLPLNIRRLALTLQEMGGTRVSADGSITAIKVEDETSPTMQGMPQRVSDSSLG